VKGFPLCGWLCVIWGRGPTSSFRLWGPAVLVPGVDKTSPSASGVRKGSPTSAVHGPCMVWTCAFQELESLAACAGHTAPCLTQGVTLCSACMKVNAASSTADLSSGWQRTGSLFCSTRRVPALASGGTRWPWGTKAHDRITLLSFLYVNKTWSPPMPGCVFLGN
jgi:hypothetical protein